uniref:Uncharacterized protein n=1 Tax=Kalanchoe fedtschenkoi TaxID=63787 RepID=A0A7N0VKJ3_KALFE
MCDEAMAHEPLNCLVNGVVTPSTLTVRLEEEAPPPPPLPLRRLTSHPDPDLYKRNTIRKYLPSSPCQFQMLLLLSYCNNLDL